MIKYLLLFFLMGCMNSLEINDMEIQDISTPTVDLRQFNCDIDRIDASSKKTWKNNDYYWDCQLKTYCKPEIINNELLCAPIIITKLYQTVAFYDDKCTNQVNNGEIYITFNNDEDIEVPSHITFLDGWGIWIEAIPLYYGPKIRMYWYNGLGKCDTIQYTNPILYISKAGRIHNKDLFKIDWQWKK